MFLPRSHLTENARVDSSEAEIKPKDSPPNCGRNSPNMEQTRGFSSQR
jgi:hypothetical protein